MNMKKYIVILFVAIAFNFAKAQTSVIQSMYNPGNTYSLAKLLTTVVTRDTVTDTGTAYVCSKRISGPGQITIQINITKVSGTVAGTVTLMGSLDGVNFKAMPTQETQTGLATVTATNGSTSFSWRLSSSPYLYYQANWVGTGSMVAYLDGFILKH